MLTCPFGGQPGAAGIQLVNQPVLVNGSAGVVVFADGEPSSVIFGKIVEINVLADPARLSQLDLRPSSRRPRRPVQ